MTSVHPESVTILLDAATDLADSGDLHGGNPRPDPADYATDDAYDAAMTAHETETARRVEWFAAAYRATAAEVAARYGINIEVLDYHQHPDRKGRTPITPGDPDSDTWEDRLWREIHDETPTLDPRTRLGLATAERDEAVAYTGRLWREAITGALAEGVGATETARLAGISRERVYQIRDGR